MAYIEPPNRTEVTRTFKKHIYETLILMAAVWKTPPVMRIVHKQPDVKWNRVWQKLHESRAPEEVRTAWYAVIHDILPTRERIAVINLTDTANCRQCNANDSLSHWLTECGEGPAIRSWTKSKIALMLRIDPKHVLISWALYPDFQLWPQKRRRAVSWTLAHMVWYQTNGPRRPTMVEYIDYMRRSRWKEYIHPKRLAQLGNYLNLI